MDQTEDRTAALIEVPASVADQLVLLAKKQGFPIAGLVARMLSHEIRRHQIDRIGRNVGADPDFPMPTLP